jgi:O-antigen ligase
MTDTEKTIVSPGLLEQSGKVLEKVVFISLLGLIVIAVIPYGTVDAWWEAFFECAVFTLTGLWIFEVLLRGRWQVKGLFILLPLIVITVYAFAQTVVWPGAWLATGSGRIAQQALSIDRYQTYLTARKALALTLFLGLLILHTSTPRRFRWLVQVVIGLGLASALFGILRQLLQPADSPSGFLLPFLFPGFGYGQFLSSNVFAYLMEMTLGLLLGMVLGGGLRRDRVPIYLAIALLVWTALVLSNSRGAILGLTCQSIFLLFTSLTWYSARRAARGDVSRLRWLTFIQESVLARTLVIVLIGGTLIVGVLWMGGERLASKLRTEASKQETIDGASRREIWRSSWKLIREHPLSGVGFGAYFLAIPEYQISSGRLKLEQAHNDYLDLAANGGLIAVGLAAWFIAMVIWRAGYSLRSRDAYRRAASLGAAAGLLSVGVHSLVDFGLQVTGIGVVFAALIVILVADHNVESLEARKGERRPHRRRTGGSSELAKAPRSDLL